MQVSIKKYFGLKESFLLIIGIVILFVVISFLRLNAERTFLVLKSTPISILLAFILIRASGFLVGNYKWNALVDKIRKTNFATLLPIYMAGNILDNLVPGPGFGAEPVKAYYLGKAIKKSAASCFATALVDNILLAVVSAVYLVFSVLYLYFFIHIFVVRVAVGILLAFFLLFGLAALYFRLRKERRNTLIDKFLLFIYNLKIFSFLRKKFGTFEKFRGAFQLGIENLKGTTKKLWNDKKRIYYVLFLTFIATLLGYLGHYVLLFGYGIDVKIYAIIAIFTISDLIGYYSPIPAGTGIIEGSRIPMLIFIGVPAEIATAITIIDRVVFYISTYGVGYASLSYVSLKYSG